MSQPTLFISDLHLHPAQPQITRIFLRFLAEQATQAEALYILGDFFEVWMGDDDCNDFNEMIKAALKQLTTHGVPVYFMAGNRDFLLGAAFAKATGCQLLQEPTVIELYGTSTLLVHGDSLCTQDIKHQYFRQFSRHPLTKKLFLSLPLWWRQRIARRLRNISSKRTQSMTSTMMDVTPSAVTTLMQQYQVTRLIHGHTHRPYIHSLTINDQPAQRIVLGAWHDVGSVLVCRSQQQPELIQITA